MILEGTVRNIVDFGLFVDIGPKMTAVHILTQNNYVRHPIAVAVGDIVRLKSYSHRC